MSNSFSFFSINIDKQCYIKPKNFKMLHKIPYNFFLQQSKISKLLKHNFFVNI